MSFLQLLATSNMSICRRYRGVVHQALGHRRMSSWLSCETPNPDVRKFESKGPNIGSLPDSTRQKLLELPGVSDVFSASSWLSITRTSATVSWDALESQIQALLGDSHADAQPRTQGASSSTFTGIAAEIQEVLDHRIRPSVQEDGGDVELLRWDENGQVTLSLRGACRGCPQSRATLQDFILKTLSHYVPQVKTVVAEEEESDLTDPCADLPFEHNGKADQDAIIRLVAAGTPFFSTFAGRKVEGPMLKRVKFMSQISLSGRTPEHIFVSCVDCKARRTIEDPLDLLKAEKGNQSGSAAVVICPTCCVVITP
jgi:NFU1 iron-sulfur cluster scaffold homolog, mitochondrial